MPFYDNTYDDSYGREQRLFDNVTILPADRKPCLVCGHPTGDCAGDKASQTKKKQKDTKIKSNGT
jgi:hypothetical protein